MKKRQTCKLLSLLLAMVMLAALAVPAFAAGEDEPAPLWFLWLDEDWESGDRELYLRTQNADGSEYIELQPGYPSFGILGTGDCRREDGSIDLSKFTPVDPGKVTVPNGITLSADVAVRKGAKWGEYYCELSTTVRDQELKLTSGKAELTVNTGLPDVGVYTAPKASWANWAGQYEFRYNPAKDNTFYIIANRTDAKDGFHLSRLSLNGWEENKLVTLSKAGDSVYKVELKPEALMCENFHIEVNATWTNADGDSWTDEGRYIGNFDAWRPILASDTALMDGAQDEPDFTAYSAVKDKLSGSVTMKAGETKDVYLYSTWLMEQNGKQDWWVHYVPTNNLYYTTGKGLTITQDGTDYSKFTLSASEPGSYEVFWGYQLYDTLYHADGKAYTDADYEAFEEKILWKITDGKLMVCGDWDPESYERVSEFVPFEELFPGERYTLGEVIDQGIINLTVAVPFEFTDVKDGDYFADPVKWAVENGVTNGTSTTSFSPGVNCTQAQILTFLYRAEQGIENPTAADMEEAVKWARGMGMIDASFEADKFCTRSTAVSYIWQAFGCPEAKAVSFSDVDANADYAAAVSWALEKKVTNGTSIEKNTFDPDEVCSRGQIATFLYRAYVG